MPQPENIDRDGQATARRTARNVGLRIAALTGVVLAAGAIAAAPSNDVDLPIDTVVSGGVWPMGSTCCPDDPE